MGFFGFLFAIHAVDTLRSWVRPTQAIDADELTGSIKELTGAVRELNTNVQRLDVSIREMKK